MILESFKVAAGEEDHSGSRYFIVLFEKAFCIIVIRWCT